MSKFNYDKLEVNSDHLWGFDKWLTKQEMNNNNTINDNNNTNTNSAVIIIIIVVVVFVVVVNCWRQSQLKSSEVKLSAEI